MSVMQNFTAQIWDWNDELVQVPMFQLLQWKHALKLEITTQEKLGEPMRFKGGKLVSTHVRKVLGAPRNLSKQAMFQHLADSIDSINDQLRQQGLID